jgi:DNA-binding transcriptional MerR regulator
MEQQEKFNLLPIGKMAKANRVTIATLRLYDEMDLLTPTYTDPETGYRYYDIRQTSRLDFIRYMRDLGLSLSDIHDLLALRVMVENYIIYMKNLVVWKE